MNSLMVFQPFDKRSAWVIKAAVRYDSGSTILKLLQLVNFYFYGTSTKPNGTVVSKKWAQQCPCKDSSNFLLVKKFLHV